MNIKIKSRDKKTTVLLSGNIDVPSAEALKKSLFQVAEKGAKEVILDFEEVTSIGSSGVGALILFQKQFSPLGGKTAIINVNKEIYSLFSIIKLDKIFEISAQEKPDCIKL